MPPEDEGPPIDRLIDANLRRVYESVLNEEVPDHLTDLLRKLREAEGGSEPGSDAADDGDAS